MCQAKEHLKLSFQRLFKVKLSKMQREALRCNLIISVHKGEVNSQFSQILIS